MIGFLEGEVLDIADGELTVDTGGVGYQVKASNAAECEVGHIVRLSHIHTSVTETSIALFGFPTADERRCFRLLIGIHGVGPAMGLGLLSMFTPAELAGAVFDEDVASLSRAPGVGKKTAERLVLDLKTKLEPFLGEGRAAPARRTATAAQRRPDGAPGTWVLRRGPERR